MNVYTLFIIWLAKFISFCIKLFGLGSGATWPGEIVLRFNPNILGEFRKQIHGAKKIVFIAGTNGKTTTAKMLETIFKSHHKKVARNTSGANLDNGIISTFITHTSLWGTLTKDIFIFEVDEATLPNVLNMCPPDILILLNLFRDQLDRYGEVDAIAEKWLNILQRVSNKMLQLIINGDDPHLAYIGMELEKKKHIQLPIYYLGLNNDELFLPSMQHATDSIFCPHCGNRLTFGGFYFSHLGKYACGQCGFTHPKVSLTSKDVTSPLPGVYNIYNVLASTLCAKLFGISIEQSQLSLSSFIPAFGRMEKIQFKNKVVQVLLSKNPTGFNESMRTIVSSGINGPILFVLNDRIPDGADISWIYDVDFEVLVNDTQRKIILSGDRCFDLGVRFQYAGFIESQMTICERLEEAIEIGIKELRDTEQLWILPTYSAMLETRKILVGRKIL